MPTIEEALNSFMQLGKLLKEGPMIGASEVRKFLEMYESLQTAINRAGGAGYSVHELSNMTVVGLIQRLATNNVRFIYAGPKRPEKEED